MYIGVAVLTDSSCVSSGRGGGGGGGGGRGRDACDTICDTDGAPMPLSLSAPKYESISSWLQPSTIIFCRTAPSGSIFLILSYFAYLGSPDDDDVVVVVVVDDDDDDDDDEDEANVGGGGRGIEGAGCGTDWNRALVEVECA